MAWSQRHTSNTRGPTVLTSEQIAWLQRNKAMAGGGSASVPSAAPPAAPPTGTQIIDEAWAAPPREPVAPAPLAAGPGGPPTPSAAPPAAGTTGPEQAEAKITANYGPRFTPAGETVGDLNLVRTTKLMAGSSGVGQGSYGPTPDEIKQKALDKINKGETLDPSDYEGLDDGDKAKLEQLAIKWRAQNKILHGIPLQDSDLEGLNDDNKTKIKSEELKEKIRAKIIGGVPFDSSEMDGLDREDAIEIRKLFQAKEAAATRLKPLQARAVALLKNMSAVEVPKTQVAESLEKKAEDLYYSGNYDEMSATLDALEPALKEAEAVRLERPKYQREAEATAKKIADMKDDEIEKLPPTEAARLIRGLVAAGKPEGALLEAQLRLYKHTKLDKKFLKADEAHEKQVAASLKGDKDLEAARNNWDRTDMQTKIAALQKLVNAQCKAYGIPTLKLLLEEEAATKGGYVDEGLYKDGKMWINFGPDAHRDFRAQMKTVFHEVAHYYQDTLVAKFNSGELKPDDPLYGQAALFAADKDLWANVQDPDEHSDKIYEGYQAQPNERHSFETSEAMTTATMKVL
jgi:hypothetical protein